MEQMKSFPAVDRLKEYAATMIAPDLTGFPEPIRDAWEKFASLVSGGQVTGARMALKDLYEVTLKTVVLTAAHEIYQDYDHRTEERNHFLQVLFVKNPAFGYWKQEIGGGLLRVLKKERESGQMSMQAERILSDLLKRMEKHQIVAWRNQDAHGAAHDLQNVKAVQELIDKWEVLREHWVALCEAYQNLPFAKTEMYPFVTREEGQWFFFDSFLYEKEKIVFLNYRNNRRIQAAISGIEAFYERFQMQPVEAAKESFVDSDALTDWEMAQLKRERRLSRLERPEYLVSWLKEQLTAHSGGYLLLQMERGMGKTTFARMLDPSGETGVRLGMKDDMTIRCYTITPFFNRQSVVSFARELEYQFSHEYRNGQQERVFGGSNEARIETLDDMSKMRENLAAFLNHVRKLHEKRFGRERLLLVLDGADEVMTEEHLRNGFLQVTDILPEPGQLDEGIYILLLSRTDREMEPYRVWDRVGEGWHDPLPPVGQSTFVASDEGYRKVVMSYVKDMALSILDEEEVADFLRGGSWNFVFAAAATELIRLYALSEEEALRQFLKSVRGLEDLFDRYMGNLRFVYGTEYFEDLKEVLLALAAAPGGKTLTSLARLRQEGGISYRLLSMVQDLSPFVKEIRDGRESRYGCANLLVREMVLQRCGDTFTTMAKSVLEAWLLDPEEEPEQEYLRRAPFCKDRFRAIGMELIRKIEDAEEEADLSLLETVELRYQEAKEKSPFGPYILKKQLERTQVYARQLPLLVQQIQDAPEVWHEELLKSFWKAYNESLEHAYTNSMKKRHDDKWTPEEEDQRFYWWKKTDFSRIWEVFSTTFYPQTCPPQRWWNDKFSIYEQACRYAKEAECAFDQLTIVMDQMYDRGYDQVYRFLTIQSAKQAEEQLLYLCLSAGYLRMTSRDKTCQEAAWLEGMANGWIKSIWDWYEQYERYTKVWRDCLYWSVPTWMRERLEELDQTNYADFLAKQVGLSVREFVDQCHRAFLRANELVPIYLTAPMKEWLAGGSRIISELNRAIGSKSEDLWAYLRIEGDYLQKVNRKHADHMLVLQLGQMLYTLHEKKDFENFLRAYRELAELLPGQSWLQRRNIEKKLRLSQNMPTMVTNMIFLLASEGNEGSRRSLEDVIYRNQAWFGLPKEEVDALVCHYVKPKDQKRYLHMVKLCENRKQDKLGHYIYKRPEEEALYVALNRASCYHFWKMQEKPVAKLWCQCFEVCADDLEATLPIVEQVMEMPATFDDWTTQIQTEIESWRGDQRNSMLDESLCHAVVFRKKAEEWGRERVLPVWMEYLRRRLDEMSKWQLKDRGKYKVTKWQRLVSLEMEALIVGGQFDCRRHFVLQERCRNLLQMMRGALNGYEAPEFRESFSLLIHHAGGLEGLKQAKEEWEPQLLFVLLWYLYLDQTGEDVEKRREIRGQMQELLAQKEAFDGIENAFLTYICEHILSDLIVETGVDIPDYRGWIDAMTAALAQTWKTIMAEREFKAFVRRYIQVGHASLYGKIAWHRNICIEAMTDILKATKWEILKEQVALWRKISELFRESLMKAAQERFEGERWKQWLSGQGPTVASYAAAMDYINKIDGTVRTYHVDKAVNDLRRVGAYLNSQGETEQAMKVYEGLLLICQSCEEDFMTEDYPAHRELEMYFFGTPWQIIFRHGLLGYCIAVLEYMDLLETDANADALRKACSVGEQALQKIARMERSVPEHRREYYREMFYAWEPIAQRVKRLTEIVNKTTDEESL